MLRKIRSQIPFSGKPVATPALNSDLDNIFVITQRRPRQEQREADVELGETGQAASHLPKEGHISRRDEQPELQLYSNPVYLKTQLDIMYYLGVSPLKGDGQWGSKIQKVAFAIFSSLAIVNSILKLKQFIVNHVEKGNLFQFITAWQSFTRILPQLYFVITTIRNRRFISKVLEDSTKIKSGNLYKFPADKISKFAVALACIRVLMGVANTIRIDWWLAGYTVEDVFRFRSYVVSRYIFIWRKNNETERATENLYNRYSEEITSPTIVMGSVGVVLQYCINLHGNMLQDTLLMAALHTYRLGQIFQCNIQDTVGTDIPNERNLPLLREKHNTFYQMAKGIEEGFGGFFMLQHVVNYIFCAYLLLDALRGEAENVFLPEAVISLPVIACTYIVAARTFGMSQGVHTILRDRDLDNTNAQNAENINVSKFLKKLKSYPIAIGRGNFMIDESFVQRFVGLVVTSFLLFVDAGGNKP